MKKNFGPDSAVEITVAEFADKFCRSWGDGANWSVKPEDRSVEAKSLSIDSAMSKYELNWMPRLPIEDAISWTVRGYKSDDILGVVDSQLEAYDALMSS